jgi:hypothetical protein
MYTNTAELALHRNVTEDKIFLLKLLNLGLDEIVDAQIYAQSLVLESAKACTIFIRQRDADIDNLVAALHKSGCESLAKVVKLMNQHNSDFNNSFWYGFARSSLEEKIDMISAICGVLGVDLIIPVFMSIFDTTEDVDDDYTAYPGRR